MTDPIMHGSGFGAGYDAPLPVARRWRQTLLAALAQAGKAILRAGLGLFGIADQVIGWFAPHPPMVPGTWHPKRILVIRTDFLGDVVLTLPAIQALARTYPAAEIDFLVLPRNAPIVQDQPGIARVISCEPLLWLGSRQGRAKLREAIAQAHEAKYDLAISVCGDTASIVARLSGAKRRIGFAGEAFPGWLTDPVPGKRYTLGIHESRYGLMLAAAAGAGIPPLGMPQEHSMLRVGEPARQRVAELLALAGIAAERPVIALHPGSGNGNAKRWPLPHWAKLAEMLLAEEDAAIVLIGAPDDRPLAQGIMRRMAHLERVTDLTGQTTLLELAALLQRADVVVTGDSGPLHVAEAVGTRVVALHGPTDPAQSGPIGPEAIVFWNKVWCAPCYNPNATAECRFGNPICMKGLMPAEVLPAVRQQFRAACGMVEESI
jgi:lipopolysaccharide heptosyltransferase II